MSTIPLPSFAFSARIAIIGGGIAGLSAAHRLRELLPNAELSLFEASNRIGGVLETIERNGFLIERSADNFLATPTAAVDLCRRLEMDSELLPTDKTRRRAFVVHDGQLLPMPRGFYLMSPRKLWPILCTPLLSLGGKLRLLAEPFVKQGQVSDESIASFARRRLGNEVFERIVQPLVAGIYTADPEKLSMAATMPQFLDFERNRGGLLRATLWRHTTNSSQSMTRPSGFGGQMDDSNAANTATGARYNLFLAPVHGMQSLVTTLAQHLPSDVVQLNASVASINRDGEVWSLAFNPKSQVRDPKSTFGAVVVAVPAYAAAKFLVSTSAALAAELAAVEYAGCAVVSFGFHRSQIGNALDGFGFVVPRIEHRRIIAASFASLKYPGRAPEGDVLIRVFLGGALQPELLEEPDAHLRQFALNELADLLQIRGEPMLADIARWPRSMPQYHVGHPARVARIEQLAASFPTLALAGNAYHGVGIPQCIASGQAAAEHIAAALSGVKE